MMTEVIAAGVLMGFASGIHCLGMCGPLVASFPPGGSRLSILLDPYHFSRIGTYGILGIFSGLIGTMVSFAGLQVFAGFALLILLTVSLIFLFQKKLNPGFSNHSAFVKIWSLGMSKGKATKRVILGAMNGLLPCGMVYFALATSLSWGSTQGSVVFMLAFGFGTLPFLWSVPVFGKILPAGTRKKLKPFQAVFFLASILLVLWRVVIEPLNLQVFLPWVDSSPMCN